MMTKEELKRRFALLCPTAELKVLTDTHQVDDAVNGIAESLANIPELYGQEGEDEPTVYLHFFGGDYDWYITEWSEVAPDGCKNLAFGYVTIGAGYEGEFTYVSINEIKPIEIVNLDLHFKPCKIKDLDI